MASSGTAPSPSGDGEPSIPRGPRKRAGSGPRAPRVSLHKARAAWFGARVTWPFREAPLPILQAERARARERLEAATNLEPWTLAGPTNIGGRCTALVCEPGRSDHVWIGSAGGGVWASADGGRHWRESWTEHAPLQIGSLALDPSNPKTLYCGTGEANLSVDSYPGDGIYRSLDAGVHWERWAAAGASTVAIPRRIGAIAVDPTDPDHVMVGGVGYGKV